MTTTIYIILTAIWVLMMVVDTVLEHLHRKRVERDIAHWGAGLQLAVRDAVHPRNEGPK